MNEEQKGKIYVEANLCIDQDNFSEPFDIVDESQSQQNCDKNIKTSNTSSSVEKDPSQIIANKTISIEAAKTNSNNLQNTKNCTKYKCKFTNCTFEFSNRFDLKRHTEIHCLIEFVCDKCNRIYHSKNAIKWHLEKCRKRNGEEDQLTFNDDVDSGPIFCEECKQLFENQKVLKFHQKFCLEVI